MGNGAKKVIVGGTFDFLHAGHRALLAGAFSLGDVTVGLVSDEMAKRMKTRENGIYKDRKEALVNWVKREIKKPVRIIELNDRFGPTLKEDFDYIVVSPETYETAVLINQERQKINKKPIEIKKIDFVLAQDGKPISSTRVFNGEIDIEGKLLKL